MRLIFSLAISTSSGFPVNLMSDPLESIFRRGNFFLRISNFVLFTPKNSIGLIVSRLMSCSVNVYNVYVIQ